MRIKLNGFGKAALAIAAAAALSPFSTQAASKLIAAWNFEKVEASGEIKDIIGGKAGTVAGSAVLTAGGGGRPGAGGGKGFDTGPDNPGWLQYDNGDIMNTAAETDAVTVVLWQKNRSNINSSSFWAVNGSGGGRGFQFHIPWSDGTIYFDTQGCCANPTQRLNMAPGIDFNEWHHYAFVKGEAHKAIYIDGNLLIEVDGADPITADFTMFSIGAANNASPPDGIIDDFGIYKGALTTAEITAVMKGGFVLTDTDKDGISDDWEKEYGFNPNDPADAKLDPDKDGCDNLCEYNAGTDPNDTTPPTVVGTSTTASFDSVLVEYSEVVDPVAAGDKASYKFTPALDITGVVLKGKKVTLTTAKQTPGEAYTLTINNVIDQSKNKLAADTKVTVYSWILLKGGVLKFSAFNGISGNPVDNLLSDPKYPSKPDFVAAAASADSRTVYPDDSHDNYGGVMEGVLTPTESGVYNFFLRSDDASQLFLSTDNKPANLAVIAEETGCCAAFQEPGDTKTSTEITLVAGKGYYFSVVWKEGGGGDFAQVAWRKAGDTTAAGNLKPIPGKFFTAEAPGSPFGKFLSFYPPNKASSAPGNKVEVSHLDGRTSLTEADVSLEVDGQIVKATVVKNGSVLTLTYLPSPEFPVATSHTAKFNYKDAGGKATSETWVFATSPFDKDTLFVEAEDFDFDGGKTITNKKIGMDGPYVGGDFDGLGSDADVEIDYVNAGGNAGQPYRPGTGIAAGKPNGPAGLNRFTFQVEKNWTVGWNDPGDWQNYTRTFPATAKKYNIYAHMSSGGAPINGQLDRVTKGVGTTAQTLEYMATVKPGRATAGWDNLEVFQFIDKAGAPAVAELGGKVTYRFTTMPGANLDIDWFAFTLAKDPVKAGPKFTSITVKGLDVTLTWEGGGTLQVANDVTGPWVDVTGATSPLKTTADQARRFARVKQ